MINAASNENSRMALKVIGVGGAGINAVNALVAAKLLDVKFLAAAMRESDLVGCDAHTQVMLTLPQDNGVGSPVLAEFLQGAGLLLIIAGMGGATGTALAPVIARKARAAGGLVMAIVMRPFASEGKLRIDTAEKGIELLRDCCDCLVIIPNDSLHQLQNGGSSLFNTFRVGDDIISEVILALTEQGREQGDCYVEMPRLREILAKPGAAGIAIGSAGGENRAVEAARKALACPLIADYTLNSAAGLIISITGDSSVTVQEFTEAVNVIASVAADNAPVVSGMAIDEALDGRIRVTIIATGLQEAPALLVQEDLKQGFISKMLLALKRFFRRTHGQQ